MKKILRFGFSLLMGAVCIGIWTLIIGMLNRMQLVDIYAVVSQTMIASIFPVLMSKSTSPTKPRLLQSFTFITSRCLSSQIRIDINLPDPSVIKICTKGPGGSSWTGISIYFYFVTSDNVTLSKCSV